MHVPTELRLQITCPQTGSDSSVPRLSMPAKHGTTAAVAAGPMVSPRRPQQPRLPAALAEAWARGCAIGFSLHSICAVL